MSRKTQSRESFSDIECDVLVIGGGAAGLSAAVRAASLGADVVLIERDDVLGGASSWSGGWMWTPGTQFAREAGRPDDVAHARQYLEGVLGERFDAPRVDAFLYAAPRMVSFFHDQTDLQFVVGAHVNDIYGDLPGAGVGFRSVAPRPINARRVPRHLRHQLRRQLYETSFLGMGVMAGADLQSFLAASQGSLRGLWHATWRVGFHVIDMILHRQGMRLVNGTALVARLALSAHKRGVRLLVGHSAEQLLTDADGRVTGARTAAPRARRIRARAGVILATGGYPHDVERANATFPTAPGTSRHLPLPPQSCDGTGIRIAEAVGAHFTTDVASPAAWCPVSEVPYRSGRRGFFPHIMDRAKPGSVGVLASGKRFVNEANGYYDYVSAMIEGAQREGTSVQSWQIADHRFARRYPFGMAKSRPVPLGGYVRSGYLVRGNTLRELAEKCGIDPVGLERTVMEFNAAARSGVDHRFGRGSTRFNRYGGDKKVSPNPSLGEISRGPFYAVKVHPGLFGTFAGLAADEHARALRANGSVIDGLYVAGNDQASVMGGTYPSGGINLGPAMVFGYLAAEHAVGTLWS